MRTAIAFSAAVVSLAGVATAQERTLGEIEYMNSCAACHGASGEGDGPIVPYLVTQTMPDLTMLQANNDGVFPVTETFMIIEGTADVGAHGSRDMPVWGDRYRDIAEGNPDMTDYEVEAYANLRVIALVEYLTTIQQ
jgi:mono/diheme cytochrome c family protein